MRRELVFTHTLEEPRCLVDQNGPQALRVVRLEAFDHKFDG